MVPHCYYPHSNPPPKLPRNLSNQYICVINDLQIWTSLNELNKTANKNQHPMNLMIAIHLEFIVHI